MTSYHDRPTQTFASIGIDIGKDVFHIAPPLCAGQT